MLFRGRLRSVAVLAAVGVSLASQSPKAQSTAPPSPDSVGSLIEAGRYEAAETLARNSYSTSEGTAAANAASATLVEAFVANGRGAEPRVQQLAERLVSELRSGSSAPAELATALRNLGEVWYHAGKYNPAIDRLKESVAIRERIDPGSPELAKSLEHLVQALTEVLATDVVAYATGVKLADRAVEIRRTSDDRLSLARSLRIRGLLRQRNGDYARARADLQESLSTLETASPTHPETARALLHVGEQLGIDGALTRGLEAMARACDMAETVLRAGHPDIADCLRRQAAAREETGDLTGAKTLRERGTAIARSSLGETHPKFAVQLNDLANNYQLQYEFATARLLYEEARKAYIAGLGATSNPATVTSLNLGLLDGRIGDYRQARRELEKVISTWTATLGPDHPNTVRAISGLASVLTSAGMDAQARPLHARVLAIRERLYGREHPLVARTLSNFAATLSRLGQSQRALELSTRAIHIWERTGSSDGLAEAAAFHAEILSRTGDNEGATSAYRRALEARRVLLGPSHPLIAETEVALAGVEAGLGRASIALGRALEGQRIAREHALLALRSLPERQALEYASTRLQGLELALSLAVSDEDRRAVFNEVVLNRALTLDEMSARRRIASEAKNSGTKSLWDELSLARQRLANLFVRGPRGNADDYARLLDEARTEKESLERTLGERSATFRASERRAAVALPQVRNALPAGAVLVSFIRYNRIVPGPSKPAAAGATANPSPVASYSAFVLRSGAQAPALIHLGAAAAIDRAITTWRQELLAGASLDRTERAAAERTLRVSGSRLRARIWDPIAAELGGATRVFVVPDAAINRVPIAALPMKSGGYLLEGSYVVHYLSAERDLVADGAAPPSSGGMLAVGGVAFDASVARSSARADTVLSRSATSDPTDRGAATCLAFQRLRFPTLPATRRESEEVARLWSTNQPTGSESRTLLGSNASETTFKELAPRQAILHLATHGFFLGDDCDSVPALAGTRAVGGVVTASQRRAAAPRTRSSAMLDSPLVLTGLAFAGANRRAAAAANGDDGILTAEEVASLNLTGVQWAVLSACDTGLGLIRENEGVLGLRRSFQTAGARTVIMSLWPAADDATRQWMRSLYQARLVDKRDTADAVRDAALSVLRAHRRSGQSGHPFFWGGFVATGDWH